MTKLHEAKYGTEKSHSQLTLETMITQNHGSSLELTERHASPHPIPLPLPLPSQQNQAPTLKCEATIKLAENIAHIWVSPNGRRICVEQVSSDHVSFVVPMTGKSIGQHFYPSGLAQSLGFSSDSRKFAFTAMKGSADLFCILEHQVLYAGPPRILWDKCSCPIISPDFKSVSMSAIAKCRYP